MEMILLKIFWWLSSFGEILKYLSMTINFKSPLLHSSGFLMGFLLDFQLSEATDIHNLFIHVLSISESNILSVWTK